LKWNKLGVRAMARRRWTELVDEINLYLGAMGLAQIKTPTYRQGLIPELESQLEGLKSRWAAQFPWQSKIFGVPKPRYATREEREEVDVPTDETKEPTGEVAPTDYGSMLGQRIVQRGGYDVIVDAQGNIVQFIGQTRGGQGEWETYAQGLQQMLQQQRTQAPAYGLEKIAELAGPHNWIKRWMAEHVAPYLQQRGGAFTTMERIQQLGQLIPEAREAREEAFGAIGPQSRWIQEYGGTPEMGGEPMRDPGRFADILQEEAKAIRAGIKARKAVEQYEKEMGLLQQDLAQMGEPQRPQLRTPEWMKPFIQGQPEFIQPGGEFVTPGGELYGKTTPSQWQQIAGLAEYWGKTPEDLMFRAEQVMGGRGRKASGGRPFSV
jgi:hypothetical protein